MNIFQRLFGRAPKTQGDAANVSADDLLNRLAQQPSALSPAESEKATRSLAEDYIEAQNFTMARLPLERMALYGDPWAEFWLGKLAANGIGTPRDLPRAVALFQSSAEQGYAPAASALAFLYMTGQGVDQDSAQGMHWMTRAAAGGDTAAQFNLAKAYSDGAVIERNDDLAAKWMLKAAESGLPAARLGSAIWLLLGKHMAPDRDRATALLQELAAEGSAEARHWLDRIAAGDA